MLTRILVAAVIVAGAAGVAVVVDRARRRKQTPVVAGREVPERIDRADFDAAAAPWIVVLFSSTTCDSCTVMRPRVTALGADDVAVYDVEYPSARVVHERYGIAAVPTTVIADGDGVVRASWVGKVAPDELAAALAALRA